MYLSHFGLNEPPFRITPHTDFFFAGAKRGATLEALLYAITHDEGIVKVSGEVGSGKTMLCRVLMERLPRDVETIYLANPSLSREEILFAIADELKLALTAERTTRLLRELQDHLIRLYGAGRRVVVLIDEAHAMPKETLEEIRLLSNLESGRHKLLQIVLFGQPELDDQLGSADMRQLKERITHGFRLEPLVRDDIESYIDFRMRAAGYRGPKVFTPAATRMIASASEGLTRRVNILADKSLLAAFSHDTHGVTEKEARAAIRDSDFFRPQGPNSRFRLAATGVAAGLIAGAAAGWMIHTMTADAPATVAAIAPATPAPPAALRTATSNLPPALEPATATRPAGAQGGGTGSSSAGSQPGVRAAVEKSAGPLKTSAVAMTAASEKRLETAVLKSPVKATEDPAERNADGPRKLGKLTRQRFDETQAWLNATADKFQSIQMLTVTEDDASRLERFLHKVSALVPLEDLHVYSVKIDGRQHYRLAYGAYKDSAEAKTALTALPDGLKGQNPYIRSVARMKSQNRQ